nr:hypothetical protein Q903MT_gene3054 [Picea sitchensis]
MELTQPLIWISPSTTHLLTDSLAHEGALPRLTASLTHCLTSPSKEPLLNGS